MALAFLWPAFLLAMALASNAHKVRDLQAEESAYGSRGERLHVRQKMHAARAEEREVRDVVEAKMKEKVWEDEAEEEAPVLLEAGDASEEVKAELEAVREMVRHEAQAELMACFATHVQVDMRHGGRFRTFIFKATLPDTYPKDMPRFDITSTALSDAACRKIETGCAAAADKAREAGKNQAVLHALKFASEFARTNVLVAAFDELTRLPSEIKKADPACKLLQAAATTGDVRVLAAKGKYRAEFKLVVPANYPAEPVKTTALHHNFPAEFVASWEAQAKGRAELKADPGRASTLAASAARLPSGRAGAGTSEKARKGPVQSDTSARMASKLSSELKERTEAERRARMERAAKSEPQPHLLEIAMYLIRDCACQLAGEKCPLCQNSLLPTNPPTLAKPKASAAPAAPAADGPGSASGGVVLSSGQFGVERLVCGHYYHDACLADWFKEPPFDKRCLVCNAAARHHKYNESVALLEQRWAKRQERLREMDEIGQLMGL